MELKFHDTYNIEGNGPMQELTPEQIKEEGGFNFAPFIFLGTCMSVSLVFYVFLPYYI